MTEDRARMVAAGIETFRPGDPLEASYRDRVLALLGGLADPFSRDSFEPGHLTASGFVLDPSGERLLLVFHRAMQRWLQPGGHIEPEDEDVIAAARREVEEETGVTDLELTGEGIFDIDVHTVGHGGPVHQHFDLRMLFRAPTGDAIAGDGVTAVRWATLAELSAEHFEDSILRPARKAFGAGEIA